MQEMYDFLFKTLNVLLNDDFFFFTHHGLRRLESTQRSVHTYIFENEAGTKFFKIRRDQYLSFFTKSPPLRCTGLIDLPDPESEIRVRATLLPLTWVPGFDASHVLQNYLFVYKAQLTLKQEGKNCGLWTQSKTT